MFKLKHSGMGSLENAQLQTGYTWALIQAMIRLIEDHQTDNYTGYSRQMN